MASSFANDNGPAAPTGNDECHHQAPNIREPCFQDRLAQFTPNNKMSSIHERAVQCAIIFEAGVRTRYGYSPFRNNMQQLMLFQPSEKHFADVLAEIDESYMSKEQKTTMWYKGLRQNTGEHVDGKYLVNHFQKIRNTIRNVIVPCLPKNIASLSSETEIEEAFEKARAELYSIFALDMDGTTPSSIFNEERLEIAFMFTARIFRTSLHLFLDDKKRETHKVKLEAKKQKNISKLADAKKREENIAKEQAKLFRTSPHLFLDDKKREENIAKLEAKKQQNISKLAKAPTTKRLVVTPRHETCTLDAEKEKYCMGTVMQKEMKRHMDLFVLKELHKKTTGMVLHTNSRQTEAGEKVETESFVEMQCNDSGAEQTNNEVNRALDAQNDGRVSNEARGQVHQLELVDGQQTNTIMNDRRDTVTKKSTEHIGVERNHPSAAQEKEDEALEEEAEAGKRKKREEDLSKWLKKRQKQENVKRIIAEECATVLDGFSYFEPPPTITAPLPLSHCTCQHCFGNDGLRRQRKKVTDYRRHKISTEYSSVTEMYHAWYGLGHYTDLPLPGGINSLEKEPSVWRDVDSHTSKARKKRYKLRCLRKIVIAVVNRQNVSGESLAMTLREFDQLWRKIRSGRMLEMMKELKAKGFIEEERRQSSLAADPPVGHQEYCSLIVTSP